MTKPPHCKFISLICSEGQLGKLEALQFPFQGRRAAALFVAKARCFTGEFEALTTPFKELRICTKYTNFSCPTKNKIKKTRYFP